jgi:YVTN family beta-propeller protein
MIPSDKSYSNFTVKNRLVCNGQVVSRSLATGSLAVGGNSQVGDVLTNAGNGLVAWRPPLGSVSVSVGVNPTGMAINSAGSLGYICNSNGYNISNGDYISVIDLVNYIPLINIYSEGFNSPYTATLSSDESLLYVTNSGSDTITIIDTETNTAIDSISGLDGPSGLVIKGASTGYVNNYGSSRGAGSGNGTTVSIVNLNTNTVTSEITVGKAPACIVLNDDQTRLYVGNYEDGQTGTATISVVDTGTNEVIHTITGFSGIYGMTICGQFLFASNFGSNNFDPIATTLSIVNLATNEVTKTILLGIQVAGIARTLDEKFVYISNYNVLYASSDFSNLTAGQGIVNVLSVDTQELLPGSITVGQGPGAICIGQNVVLVSNYIGNSVSVINL